ncbi:PRC-barrel domain-containing protein [Aureimonas sp. AU40]|uniref:PRC-barrel domain-containing protein n=1 Tax=Aureimonas sp. AU40 TaxID=1637747 RepID=UPI000781F2F5|nr:PRC-barrel domain-containing protein [Aureimonas sp. AU40]
MKNIILTTAATLLLAAPALAQTTPAAPAAPTTATGAMTATAPAPGTAMGGMSGGMTMGTTSTVALKFVTVSEADVMASRLEDVDVYNNQNEDIGEIEDLVIKDGKTISGVVVSVGGFLGIGDRYVLLDPSSIVLADQNGTLRAMVNTSKDELTNAPEFKYTKRN